MVATPGADVLANRGRLRLLPFLGPAFIAAVAYIDPGNFATNIAGPRKGSSRNRPRLARTSAKFRLA